MVLNVRSTTETAGVGTRKDIPDSLPLTSGQTSPTAFAAPVVDGIILIAAARPPFQSFREGPSTVFWVAELFIVHCFARLMEIPCDLRHERSNASMSCL